MRPTSHKPPPSPAAAPPSTRRCAAAAAAASGDSSAQGKGLSSATTVYLQAPPQTALPKPEHRPNCRCPVNNYGVIGSRLVSRCKSERSATAAHVSAMPSSSIETGVCACTLLAFAMSSVVGSKANSTRKFRPLPLSWSRSALAACSPVMTSSRWRCRRRRRSGAGAGGGRRGARRERGPLPLGRRSWS